MKQVLALTLLVLAAVSGSPAVHRVNTKRGNCGLSPLAPAVDSAIVGGNQATPHEYPWQVALIVDGAQFCGGAIISSEWVLTAAHCTMGGRNVRVIAGAHNIIRFEPSQQKYDTSNFFEHEEWKGPYHGTKNDIALIKLPVPFTFNNYVQPICLPTADHIAVGTIVTATGWGRYDDAYPDTSDYLREVSIPVISDKECYNTFHHLVSETNICVATTGVHGTCNGDSGGPLNHKVGSVTELRGLTSFGNPTGCENETPAVFTRVSEYLGWIERHTGVTP